MNRRHVHEPIDSTAAATPGEVHADDRAREHAAISANVGSVSAPTSRETAATNGDQHSRLGRFEAESEGGRFRPRALMPSRRRRTARLLAAGDAERERIERDLHDGVQQQLTALRIRLSLAAERFAERGETEAGAALQGFSDDVDQVIDEVLNLARGIYPVVLTSDGLPAALVSAGVHSARPVTVRADGVRRCRPEVEVAVYFTCLAALDNAAKHAGEVSVSVDIEDGGDALQFTVCDSGAGFDPARMQVGSGIANMRERIAAVGGTLTIDSAPAHGTRVHGSVPDPGWR
jgi:signal transduction histidine kinase